MTFEKFEKGVVRLENLDVSAVLDLAKRSGMAAYVLSNVTDRDGFFNAIRAGLPLDPPLVSNRSWDALLDSLRGGLHVADARRVVIVWPGIDAMEPAADRETALDVLVSIAQTLAMPEYTRGRPTEISIVTS
ncbi:barstar family protein [Pendulispora albinea]|uniref:Barstar family protein n=1 Tax=Pendulispora albinea TaxID=2741071 RepID=A0ABZ2LR57_9BACT